MKACPVCFHSGPDCHCGDAFEDEAEALRAVKLQEIRVEQLLRAACEPLCTQCLKPLSRCECVHGRA